MSSCKSYDQTQIAPTSEVDVQPGGTILSLTVPRSGDFRFDFFVDATTGVPLSVELQVDGVSVPGTARTASGPGFGAQSVSGSGIALKLEKGQTLTLVNLSADAIALMPAAIPGAPAASLSIERVGKSCG